jgi:hypothetical protein
LQLEGLRWDELTLRPNFGSVFKLRWRGPSAKLSHKLPALLEVRVTDQRLATEGQPLPEVLVGDDAEADAFVYSLYADVLSGRVGRSLLKRVLHEGRVPARQAARCLDAVSQLSHAAAVERILIQLTRQTPPSHFDRFGPRLVPFYNYLQAAFVLAEDQRLDASSVLRVASTFASQHQFDWEALARSYLDLLRRGHVYGAVVQRIRGALDQLARHEPPDQLARMCDALEGYLRTPPPAVERRGSKLDYCALARSTRGGLAVRRAVRQI